MRISNPHPPTSFERLVQSMLTELREHSHVTEGQTFRDMRRQRLAQTLVANTRASSILRSNSQS